MRLSEVLTHPPRGRPHQSRARSFNDRARLLNYRHPSGCGRASAPGPEPWGKGGPSRNSPTIIEFLQRIRVCETIAGTAHGSNIVQSLLQSYLGLDVASLSPIPGTFVPVLFRNVDFLGKAGPHSLGSALMALPRLTASASAPRRPPLPAPPARLVLDRKGGRSSGGEARLQPLPRRRSHASALSSRMRWCILEKAPASGKPGQAPQPKKARLASSAMHLRQARTSRNSSIK